MLPTYETYLSTDRSQLLQNGWHYYCNLQSTHTDTCTHTVEFWWRHKNPDLHLLHAYTHWHMYIHTNTHTCLQACSHYVFLGKCMYKGPCSHPWAHQMFWPVVLPVPGHNAGSSFLPQFQSWTFSATYQAKLSQLHICANTHTHTPIHTHKHIHTNTHHTQTYAHTNMHINTCMHTNVYAYTHKLQNACCSILRPG